MLESATAFDGADVAQAPVEACEGSRRGRPRSELCDRAIEAAALDLVVEHGFAGMSIEGVAARAGVAKTTIYRRWDCKAALVVDAFVHRSCDRVVSPDTGSLRADLIEMWRAFLRSLQHDGGLMEAFVAEQRRHPELAEAFRATFLKQRRAVVRAVLERGVERGELPPSADLDLLVDVGSSILWYRFLITGAPLDDDLPERIVDQFFPAAVATAAVLPD
jgi:AcrR family transcriptional regulator